MRRAWTARKQNQEPSGSSTRRGASSAHLTWIRGSSAASASSATSILRLARAVHLTLARRRGATCQLMIAANKRNPASGEPLLPHFTFWRRLPRARGSCGADVYIPRHHPREHCLRSTVRVGTSTFEIPALQAHNTLRLPRQNLHVRTTARGTRRGNGRERIDANRVWSLNV